MKTVLVVDDFASVRFYHTTLLAGNGYAAVSATNGAEAISLLERQKVDLVMLDLLMPTMNGREFVKRIRALPRLQSLPVVVITTESDPAEHENIKADPAASVVVKPILPADLLQEIRRWIG